jgi:hypothetical protein
MIVSKTFLGRELSRTPTLAASSYGRFISVCLFFLFSGIANADECNDAIERYNRNLDDVVEMDRLLDERHLKPGSCEEITASCEVQRGQIDLIRHRVRLVNKVFDACGPTVPLKIDGSLSTRSEGLKGARDSLSSAESVYASLCNEDSVRRACAPPAGAF